MKYLMIVLVVLTLLLGGCTTIEAPPALTIAISPDSGHPPFDVTIAAACREEGGTYTLEVEGEDPIESANGAFSTTIDDWPWKAKVIWTDEAGGFTEASVDVSLENEVPVAHNLYTFPNSYKYHGLIAIDLRFLQKGGGCSSDPQTHTGIEDPDYTGGGYSMENDGFTYHVEIFDAATGKRESVFYGPNRTLMGDEYVENPIFYWFIAYSGAEPITPYSVWPSTEYGYISTPEKVEKRIHVYVKEWGEIRHWVYTIYARPATCS